MIPVTENVTDLIAGAAEAPETGMILQEADGQSPQPLTYDLKVGLSQFSTT